MSKKIFTTKFTYNIASEELKKIMPAVAAKFSQIPGCIWKIWIINEENNEAGGVYLFESLSELDQYINSALFSSVAKNPAFSNLQINSFDVSETASAITGAPSIQSKFESKTNDQQ